MSDFALFGTQANDAKIMGTDRESSHLIKMSCMFSSDSRNERQIPFHVIGLDCSVADKKALPS